MDITKIREQMGKDYLETQAKQPAVSADSPKDKSPDGGPAKPKEIDIKKYEDVQGGLSTGKIEFGLWIVEHRRMFRNTFVVLLILLSTATWVFSLYGFGAYLYRGMREDNLLVRQLVNPLVNTDYMDSIQAVDLLYSNIQILASNGSKYDFLAKLANPNTDHIGYFKYCFSVAGQNVGCGNSQILPSEEKYVLLLLKELKTKPANAQFSIEEISWKRVNLHETGDWATYKDEHLRFRFENISFTPASASELSGELQINNLKFVAKNNSAYNFWEAPLVIALYQGNSIVAVNRYAISEFMSGETRNISINWPGNLGTVTSVSVNPDVDILDSDTYIKIEGGTGAEK